MIMPSQVMYNNRRLSLMLPKIGKNNSTKNLNQSKRTFLTPLKKTHIMNRLINLHNNNLLLYKINLNFES